MKKLNLFSVILLFGAILFGLVSCNKEQPEIRQGKKQAFNQILSSVPDTNLVPSEIAQYFAEHITTDVFLNSGTNKTDIRQIESYYTVPDAFGKAALYVFNYENNEGYIVLSADYRYQPVCAFVGSGGILKSDLIPSMLGSWFGRTVENIEILRDGRFTGYVAALQEWNVLFDRIDNGNNTHFQIPDPHLEEGGGGGCNWWQEINVTRGPLLNTNWGQNCTYNNLCPPCTGGACGRVPTGCVATAMAQIVRYWSNSNGFNYNYASMPLTSGNGEVQRLMKDAGNAVNMDYDCSGSGADAADIDNALINTFSYSTAYYASYNQSDLQEVINNILDNQPLIFDGCTEQNSFLFWSWGSGNCHAWVCDGYRIQGNDCEKQYWLHMNWGWHEPNIPNDFHGWYFWDNWNIPTINRNYQYANHYVRRIHP